MLINSDSSCEIFFFNDKAVNALMVVHGYKINPNSSGMVLSFLVEHIFES